MERTYVPISFSKKQIIEVTDHSDPNILDKTTGERAKIAKIIIVSPDKRKGIEFGTDVNGINRDERGGYIQVPESFIKTDSKNEDRGYLYLSTNREYTVHFFGKNMGVDKDGKAIYDSPEPVKKLTAKDIRGCFGLGEYKARKPKTQDDLAKDPNKANEKAAKETRVKKADVER